MSKQAWRSTAALLAAMPLLPGPRAEKATGAVLENSVVRVVFDSAFGGAITSFVDKRSGRDFVSKDAGPSLYELVFSDTAGEKLRLTERDAARVSIIVRREGRARSAVISAPAHAGRPIGVQCTCALPDNAAYVSCRIRITNTTAMALWAVRFPGLSMPVRLGDSAEDDRLLLPKCDGVLVEDPEGSLRDPEERVLTYPGGASVQLLAFYDATAGLYAAAHDPDGHRKALGVSRAGARLELTIRHYPEIAKMPELAISYPVVLGIFHGDWQSAADEYKSWAVKQPWCRQPLAARKDLPDWLKQAPFFYAVSVRGQLPDGQSGYRGALLADNIREWGKVLESPICPMLMAWEKHGAWVTPDYFPPVGGEAAFQQLTGQLQALGYRSLVFLSGLKWTLRKTNPRYLDQPAFDDTKQFSERGEPYAIVGEDGKVQHFGRPDADVGEHAQLCPTTPLARDLLVRTALKCVDLGIAAVQVDQIVGGGMPPCYSAHHGHPVGGGNWSYLALMKAFQQIRSEGARRSRDFIFLIEEPGELYIPVLDAYHARDYAEGRWPRDGKGVRGVPLFTYLYHEYCLGYGGDSAGVSTEESRHNVLSAALNLINGKIPAAAVWGRYQPPSTVHPDQLKLIRGSLSLMRTSAREYLLFGERLHAEALDIPDITLPISIVGSDRTTRSEPRRFPAVLHSGWVLPGAKVGYIFVNLADTAMSLDFLLKGKTGETSRYRVRLFTPDSANGVELALGASLPYRTKLKLDPRQPVFLEALP